MKDFLLDKPGALLIFKFTYIIIIIVKQIILIIK